MQVQNREKCIRPILAGVQLTTIHGTDNEPGIVSSGDVWVIMAGLN